MHAPNAAWTFDKPTALLRGVYRSMTPEGPRNRGPNQAWTATNWTKSLASIPANFVNVTIFIPFLNNSMFFFSLIGNNTHDLANLYGRVKVPN